MWHQTAVTKALGIRYPLIQAPMAGGATTPELVAAVSEFGGLGSLGAGYLSPQQIDEALRAIRKLTRKPFAVNLFAPQQADASNAQIEFAKTQLQPIRASLGLSNEITELPGIPPFEEQITLLLEARIPVLSFTFGVLPAIWIKRFKFAGTYLIGTATSVAEAIQLEQAGVHAIVAQGSEAGGHRGSFSDANGLPLVGTLALVPQIADQVSVPVIAAGGIMDGRGVLASLALGAEAAQLGTAFLTCRESGIHPAYKAALLNADETRPQLTRAFSGKWARSLRNRFMEQLAACEEQLPGYPLQNALTQEIRKAAAASNNTDYLSLWAGQGVGLCLEQDARSLLQGIVEQIEQRCLRLAG